MIAAIELAIIALAKAAEPELGYAWRTLDSYPADWDVYFKDKRQLDAPALWVKFAGITAATEETSGIVQLEAHFGVVVAATSHRNETATRHGVVTPAGKRPEPGSYQLMIDAIALLVGEDFDLDIGRLMLVETSPIDILSSGIRNASAHALHFKTMVPIEMASRDGADFAPFAEFHANYDIAPFGNIDADPDVPGVQLPADATADATDHVVLPQ